VVYGVIADLLVLVHFGFVIFAVSGGLMVLRWGWVAWLHLPAALWTAGIEFGGWVCPLTYLEYALRDMAGERVAHVGFVDRYILPLLYPEVLTRDTQMVLGTAMIMINLMLYGIVVCRAVGARSK
jgi:hypothetical protein